MGYTANLLLIYVREDKGGSVRNRNINLIRLLEKDGCYTCKSYTNELHERVIEVFLGEDTYLVTLFRNDQGDCYVDSYNTIYDYGKIRAKVIAIITKEGV